MIYAITMGNHPAEQAAQAAAGGADLVQVRLKDVSTRELLTVTLEVASAVEQANPRTRVLVDDRADVAYAAMQEEAHVHGVHLGQDDLPAHHARALLGEQAIIGLTTGTLELVQQAQRYHKQHPGVLDYLGAGPFRPTPTKNSGRPPLGFAGYSPLLAATDLPIVAIGDVRVGDVEKLAETGVAGVAMVREIMQAEDPAEVVRQAREAFEQGTIATGTAWWWR
ncbi:thiamine phosphate synthase [Corynebacterium gerontici]|uniref:Thiamine-phosphate synthase n=1 Tax=Corynebacterium gerontici TaxID=2079234 RepID=A0A3G6J2S3_9CORY|nr:thiamine phosphate synthase [Corynebacterium gerontici]AZA10404.1 Thiamine-phosphate synthase [Corynebacterium gerontici]